MTTLRLVASSMIGPAMKRPELEACELPKAPSLTSRSVLLITSAALLAFVIEPLRTTSVPELMDLGKEPASTYALYGEEAKKPGTFAQAALLARELIAATALAELRLEEGPLAAGVAGIAMVAWGTLLLFP